MVRQFLIIFLIFAVISCGFNDYDNSSQIPFPATADGQVSSIEGTFILSTIKWDGDTLNPPTVTNNYFGQIFDIKVDKYTAVKVTKSEALYNINDYGFYNIDLAAFDETGKIIFSLQLNDVIGEVTYLNSYSKSYLPLYPSGAYYFDSNGKYYEASPAIQGTSGVVYLDMYFVTWPKVGDTIEGYFQINMKYQTTYQTED